MSRTFKGKDKDLVNLEVVTADTVWTKNKSGKPTLRKDIDIYGRVDKGSSAFITRTNMSGENHSLVDDTHKLPKKIKNGIVSFFKNKNRSVAWLIKKKGDGKK